MRVRVKTVRAAVSRFGLPERDEGGEAEKVERETGGMTDASVGRIYAYIYVPTSSDP